MYEDLALFRRYPRLLVYLPWVSLGIWPTPVQRMSKLEQSFNLPAFYVKRDDMSSDVYGGNKVRKLEFSLADALCKGCNRVMTVGAAGSNHVLATAVHGGRLGIGTTALLFDQPCALYVRRNLLMDHVNHVRMVWVPSVPLVPLAWAEETLRVAFLSPGQRLYRLPAGGSSPLGCLGYVNAGLEIAEQVGEGLLPEPDYVVVAMGTHGTAAGLWLGLKMGGLGSRVVGVAVVEKWLCNPYLWARLVNRTASLINALDPGAEAPRARPSDLIYIEEHLGAGYANLTSAGVRAVKEVGELEDLKLEGTYTGKAMAAALDLGGELDNSGSMLFINTHNSVDFSSALQGLDYRVLPRPFHRFFEQPCQDEEPEE
jgi:D-cysteine desulfhydrase